MLESTRELRNGNSETTYRFYISDLFLTVEEFLFYSRYHWAIENRLHWSLNQSFAEDKILSRYSNFVMNFSIILTTALTLIFNTKKKESFNFRKLMFLWNPDLILETLYLKEK